MALHHEELRPRRPSRLGNGTLACPACDLPTSLRAPRMAPEDALACPYCGHGGAVRDFLTLTARPRPARVTVTVRVPPLAPRR